MAPQSTFNLIVGTSVTFSLIACASVGLRLYARVRIIKLAKHDDAVLILSLVGPTDYHRVIASSDTTDWGANKTY